METSTSLFGGAIRIAASRQDAKIAEEKWAAIATVHVWRDDIDIKYRRSCSSKCGYETPSITLGAQRVTNISTPRSVSLTRRVNGSYDVVVTG